LSPGYPELAKDTSRSHNLGQQPRTVQGHRARPQISGCLAGRQSNTLGGRRYAQLALLVKILHSTEDHPRAEYPTKAICGPWKTKGPEPSGRELSGGSNPLGRGISLQAF